MMPAHVTHHAIRRYAERALGVGVDEALNDRDALVDLDDRGVSTKAIRRRIHEVCDSAVDLGAWSVKADNVRLMLDSGSVVTVLELGPHPRHVSRRNTPVSAKIFTLLVNAIWIIASVVFTADWRVPLIIIGSELIALAIITLGAVVRGLVKGTNDVSWMKEPTAMLTTFITAQVIIFVAIYALAPSGFELTLALINLAVATGSSVTRRLIWGPPTAKDGDADQHLGVGA